MSDNTELSVIIPVSERYDDIATLYNEYKAGVQAYTKNYEFIYVLDGEFNEAFIELKKLKDAGEKIKVIKLAKWFGEATALTAAFDSCTAENVLTLPAYYQIEASEIIKLLEQLKTHDMAVGRRWPRIDSKINRLQSKVFHWFYNFVSSDSFRDLGCGARAFKRKIIDEIQVYGDQHRFLPVLASRRGFKVIEVDVAQSSNDKPVRVYGIGVYVRRMLDILTVFFLVKFTKKPLRFFGLIGVLTFAVGAIFLLYLIIERLFFGIDLGGRPALLLSSLLVVLGVQILAMGLIGELVIFTHAKDIKEYTIEEIV